MFPHAPSTSRTVKTRKDTPDGPLWDLPAGRYPLSDREALVMRSEWRLTALFMTITFLGEQQDIIDPETAVTAAMQTTDVLKIVHRGVSVRGLPVPQNKSLAVESEEPGNDAEISPSGKVKGNHVILPDAIEKPI
jgi:hypothetical protein